MRHGIAVAGNLIVDAIKLISTFPGRHELAAIESVALSTGGLCANVSCDLARLSDQLPLTAIGLVGADGYGELILSALRDYPSIDISHIGTQNETSFTDVLTEKSTRARTFLTFAGSNGDFDICHVPLDDLNCKILHAGYIMLLPKLDAPDPEFGTRMARLLHDAQALGIKTSIDMITDAHNRYHQFVPPALKYCDYCIINETEAGAVSGISLRNADGELQAHLIEGALRKLKQMGVSHWAVVHCPEGGFGIDHHHHYHQVPGVALAPDQIVSTVGAGDAFCAGMLFAAHEQMAMDKALQLASGAAALSLLSMGASDGVPTAEVALSYYETAEKQTM